MAVQHRLVPGAITIDPRAIHVHGELRASTVGSYAIDRPAAIFGRVDRQHAVRRDHCVAIEPALGIYLFTSKQADGSVSGAQLDRTTAVCRRSRTHPSRLPHSSPALPGGEREHASSLVNP